MRGRGDMIVWPHMMNACSLIKFILIGRNRWTEIRVSRTGLKDLVKEILTTQRKLL